MDAGDVTQQLTTFVHRLRALHEQLADRSTPLESRVDAVVDVLDTAVEELRVVAERTRQLVTANASLHHEVRERARVAEHLQHAAFYDVLTDLPNRALFLDRLERVLARAQRQAEYRFAVLFLDLDDFKRVNDSLGHQAGDHLLVALARRLTWCVRRSDTVARFGGDEFAMLLDDLRDDRHCLQVVDRIHEQLSQPFILNGQEVCTNGSIGVVLSGTGSDSPDDLLRDADSAMYRAKAQGKGRYEVFDTGMHPDPERQDPRGRG